MTPRRTHIRFLPWLLSTLALPGCSSRQSTLDPASDDARTIFHLGWAMYIGASVVCAVVVLLLLIAVLRRRSTPATTESKRVKGLVLVGGFVVPIIVLAALFGAVVRTLPAVSSTGHAARLTIDVTGRQWFWDVRYPETGAITANEIHIPVGQPVAVRVRTGDVIHSFWVPRLNRKIDMIPGRGNSIALEADRPGVFRGQCAEFCGLQHAHMAFLVVAQQPADFRAWLAREARPASPPATAEHHRGLDVFTSIGCSGCHTIRGTEAHGTVGPDLTHLARRRTLAAATIPNSKGYLGGWILDPQHVKPGNKMPGLNMTGQQLEDLLSYLESLR